MAEVVIQKPVHWFAEQIWTGFYMITASLIKELSNKQKTKEIKFTFLQKKKIEIYHLSPNNITPVGE